MFDHDQDKEQNIYSRYGYEMREQLEDTLNHGVFQKS